MNTLLESRPTVKRTRLERVQWLVSEHKGLVAFEVEAGSKRPKGGSSWYLRQTNSPDQLAAWAEETPDANFGIHLGPHHVVIDLDLKHGINGIAEFTKICAENGIDDFQLEIQTLMVRTPGGGYHLYFKTPFPVANTNRFPDGIDVRGAVGYVVSPGSQDSRGEWEVVDESMPIMNCPEWLLPYLKEPGKKDANHHVPMVELDLPVNIAQAREWLETAKTATEGDGGDDHTYDVCCTLKDFGISEAEALNVLEESGWNQRCSPPWDAGALEVKIANSYEYGQNRPGIRADSRMMDYLVAARPTLAVDNTGKGNGEDKTAPLVADDIPDDTPAPLPPLQIISFEDALNETPEAVPELIPGWLEKGIVHFLSGHGESGKSHLAIQTGLCIHAGVKIIGRIPEKATFVYVSAEDGLQEVIRRAHRIAKRLGIEPEAVKGSVYIDREGLNSTLAIIREDREPELTRFYYQLNERIANIPGHKFVVFDSAYDFVRFAGQSKINEDCVNSFVKGTLSNFCRDTDSTLYIPSHPSYAGQDRGDGSGWSVAWHNAPRSRDYLTREKNSDIYILKAAKRNHTRKPEPLRLYYSDGAFVRESEATDTERGKQFRAVCVEFAVEMASNGQPITAQKNLTPAQLMESGKRLGFTVDNALVKTHLEQALMDGEIDYMPGSNTHNAGYYPKGQGIELGRKTTAERRKGKGVKTGVKTG